jgi:hypothetical protein
VSWVNKKTKRRKKALDRGKRMWYSNQVAQDTAHRGERPEASNPLRKGLKKAGARQKKN